MSIALNNAATGMLASQTEIDILSNNIANLQTAGFKEKKAVFATLASIDRSRAGTISSTSGTVLPTGLQIGLGTKVLGVTTLLQQGSPINTDNPMHFMIQGNGYFQVELPSGEIAYTKVGIFELNNQGQIVTPEGFLVSPGITVPQGTLSVEVNRDGEVYAKIAGQGAPQNVGQFELASFANPAGLESIESNLLLETPGSGAPTVSPPGTDGFGKILQRWYEGSNVNSVSAVTGLIEAQRHFEFNSKVARAVEEMKAAENQILA